MVFRGIFIFLHFIDSSRSAYFVKFPQNIPALPFMSVVQLVKHWLLVQRSRVQFPLKVEVNPPRLPLGRGGAWLLLHI